MNKKVLGQLALLLIKGSSDYKAIAQHVDALIKWRNVSWLPNGFAKWLERNDDALIAEIVKLLLDLRDELVASGALVLVPE